ncbi:hypothetical protein P3X46_030290 [Hevea brasiliensis]|uniref:Uncharacterized protein n=1 Tax=Hevea brasiliensis TaxID=3981 RepID=A0ABQ9KIB4_HEVBR|nr:uncharacterized protein LOC110671371 [Hevea brasiliensis]KAJ9139565.1 hypothetical protein P3X46_030290 [Hevea brasiliensis]
MALFLSSKAKTYLTAVPARSIPRFLALRSQSNTPSHPNHIDLSDDSSSSSSTDPSLRKLEDAIHRIIVRRAAPDWLPFLPGSSYWVPPPRSTAGSLGIAQLVEKLANPLTDEESLSMTTVRGWPSSDYFIKGAPRRSMEVKMTSNKEAEKEASSNNVSKSEDEEG